MSSQVATGESTGACGHADAPRPLRCRLEAIADKERWRGRSKRGPIGDTSLYLIGTISSGPGVSEVKPVQGFASTGLICTHVTVSKTSE